MHTQNPLNQGKLDAYFECRREEVLSAIADAKIAAKIAVELGCSSGTFGGQLKRQLGITRYIGVEIHPEAATNAAERIDQVHVTDLERATPAELGITGGVDLLVALDVLEHLIDPWEVLARWVAVLVPGGHAVMSIPNVQNITVIQNLVEGSWNYASEGLLDATHVRFFTLASINDLLAGAGLRMVALQSVLRPEINPKEVQARGNQIILKNGILKDLTRDQLMAFYTHQYIVIGRKTGG